MESWRCFSSNNRRWSQQDCYSHFWK